MNPNNDYPRSDIRLDCSCIYAHAPMNTSIEEQIDWIKSEIESQVDAGMEQHVELQSGAHKLLQFTRQVVDHVLGKIDVAHALAYVHHLQDTGALAPGPDQLTALHHYFNDCIELTLARRYA